MALIVATAGTMPQQQDGVFWNQRDIRATWESSRAILNSELYSIIKNLFHHPCMGEFLSPIMHELMMKVQDPKNPILTTMETWEAEAIAGIRKATAQRPRAKETLMCLFRTSMRRLRENLDSSNRKLAKSMDPAALRMRYERKLIPSSATLIIVPLALLEHWFEQLKLHLSLVYFTEHR